MVVHAMVGVFTHHYMIVSMVGVFTDQQPTIRPFT
jgi:hypothetical protein